MGATALGKGIVMRHLLSRTNPVLGLMAAIALVVPLALTSSTSAARLASATVAPKCVTSHLQVWLGIPGDHTAGSAFYQLEFSNVGSTACTFYGFPGVSAWNGHMDGSPAAWAHTAPTRTVTVLPG